MDNASIIFDGVRSRLRAGLIIIRNGNEILLGEEADEPGLFSLPGGSVEKGETPIDAAIREAQEEVGITAGNVEYAGCDYCECHTEVKDWVKQNVPEKEWWYNYYTCLCIGTYDGEYKGKVDPEDKDQSMKRTAAFHPIHEVIDDPSFKTAWKLALYNYGYIDDRPTDDELTESVVPIKGTQTKVITGDVDFKEFVKTNIQAGRPVRAVYDPELRIYFVGMANDITHQFILWDAIDQGYYGQPSSDMYEMIDDILGTSHKIIIYPKGHDDKDGTYTFP